MTRLNNEGEKAAENGDLAPKSNGGRTSGASPRPSAGNSQSPEPRNGKRRSDMTLEDMYNDFESDEEEEDSDWDPVLPADDDDDDLDSLPVNKWFCVNCTLDNADSDTHCFVCGEFRDSGILKHGIQASPLTGVFDDNVAGGIGDLSLQNNVSDKPTAIGFDDRMLLHEEVEMKSRPHPERPDRVRAIAASLATAGIFPGRCSSVPAREITREELQMVHALDNIDAVEHTHHYLSSYFTPDTYANKHSACAARLAAGLCFDLATTICSGTAKNGFALVRPPGHHAGVKHAMGFCLHNNAAIAALAAQRAGAKKILIVDWDVHHGNGTQEIFDRSKSVLYVSLHRHENGQFYPGTGAANEVGTMGAEGYCVNIPWSTGGVGDNDYIFAFKHLVLPIASEFEPDFTIISAGFDAARGDPLGCCDVTPKGYAQMTKMCNDLSGGKLLVILEGGYNLRSISSSAMAVIKVLLGDDHEHYVDHEVPSGAGLQTVCEVKKIQMNYWSSLRSSMLKFHSEWESLGWCTPSPRDKKKQKTQKRALAPTWWKWGRKRWLYRVFNRKLSHQL